MWFLRKTTQKARMLDFKHIWFLLHYELMLASIQLYVYSLTLKGHTMGEPGFEGRGEATKEERPSIKCQCYGVPQNDRRKCNFNLAKFNNNVHWCFSSEKNVSMYFFIICFWMFLYHHQSLPPQKLRFLCFCDFFLIQNMFVFHLLLNNLVEIENWRPESNFDPRL